MSEGWLGVAVIVTVWVLSLDGPGLMPVRFTICVPELGAITILERGSSVGGWFTTRTVTRKELVSESPPPLVVPPLSLSTTVIVALPNWLVSGEKVSVPVVLGLV